VKKNEELSGARIAPWKDEFVRWAKAQGEFAGAVIFLVREGKGYSRIDMPIEEQGLFDSDITAALLSALSECNLEQAAAALAAMAHTYRLSLSAEADA